MATFQEQLRGPEEAARKVTLLAFGLLVGMAIAWVLYRYFDPVNLFALRLQRAAVGTTNITTLSVGAALAFVSGVTMIFTPCGMPLIFTLNYIAREGREKGRSWIAPFLLFTVGIVAVMAVWGLVIGAAGGGIVRFLASPQHRFGTTEVVYSLLGGLALLMALWELRLVNLPRLGGQRPMPAWLARISPYPRSFGMGAALGGGFGIGCPFPTYQAVLVWAAVVGNPWYGAAALAANALGRSLPLVVIGGLVYHGAEQRVVSRWLVANSARARLVSGTALAAFAGLMLLLWAGLVPFALRPAG